MEHLSMSHLVMAITQVLVLAGFGFMLFRAGIIDDCGNRFIARLLIDVTVPALIIDAMIKNFSFSFRPAWWVFLLISIVFYLTGIGISRVLYSCGPAVCRSREVMLLSGFQNSAYLPLNIINVLFFGQDKDTLLIYTFLYLLGYNILMWSGGALLVFKEGQKRFSWHLLLAPTTVATVLVLLIKLCGGAQARLPEIIATPIALMGQMTFPLSMLFLGASLAEAGKPKVDAQFVREIWVASLIKLFLMPAGCLLLCMYVPGMKGLLGFFIMLQAVMPSAVSVPVVTKIHSGDYHFTSQAVVIMHILSMVSIPLWLDLFIRMTS
jgi:predicted permease